MFNRTGLAPAPNVPNPRNAGRKKSNPLPIPILSYRIPCPQCRPRPERDLVAR
ncbi:unnamed protein product [Haemonchus placei]|uniref:LITAF domain-containing protein n=1 Tax=Haemonchus placei TaxID=6290 RepID=A0A0N4W4J1_HAEPC|nr:unnamed protein product [Haemonchus placei]